MIESERKIPAVPLWLGLGGLLPFIALSLALLIGQPLPWIGEPARALLGYGAVILSFLGGVRWGFALRMVDPTLQARAMIVSVVPSLVGWGLLLLPPVIGLVLMPLCFVAVAVADRRLLVLGAPAWYQRLRWLLTIVVASSILVALIGLAARS